MEILLRNPGLQEGPRQLQIPIIFSNAFGFWKDLLKGFFGKNKNRFQGRAGNSRHRQ